MIFKKGEGESVTEKVIAEQGLEGHEEGTHGHPGEDCDRKKEGPVQRPGGRSVSSISEGVLRRVELVHRACEDRAGCREHLLRNTLSIKKELLLNIWTG